MFNLRNGIYLIIFLMPLYLWRFSIFGIPVNFLEMMIYVLFLFWVIENRYVYSLQLREKARNLYKNNYILNIGIILVFLGVIISTTFSSDIRTSLGIFKGWFVSPFLFFIVFINTIKKREQIFRSLKSWLASGVAVSLIGIFYLLSGDITFDGRLQAFFLSPNHLAMYLAPAFLIMAWFLLKEAKLPIGSLASGWKKSFFSKKMGIIVLVIISIPLYFTYSYGAFLGIFAGMVWLFYKMHNCHSDRSGRGTGKRSGGICKHNLSFYISSLRHINKKSFLKILILIIFISITAIKFNQVINSENRSSFHSRLMIWNTAVEIIKDNPLFGIGPGTFQETYLSYAGKFDQPYLEWAVPQPHNIFLAFYLQTGLIGFVGFILILIWFFSRRGAINCVFTMAEIYIINILMIYILIHGFIDTTYWKNDLSLMFWLIIGLTVANNTDSYKIKPKK